MLKALILLTSDVDHLRSVIDELRGQDAEAEIIVCSQTDIARGIEGIDGVARIITTRRVGDVSFSFNSSFIKQVRADRYSICVVLQKSKAAPVGLRAIALAYLVRSRKRRVHLKAEGFAPILRLAFTSGNFSRLARWPLSVLDIALAFLIRHAANLAVRLILLKDRLRGHRCRERS